jgi:alpha-glucosidase
LERRDFANRVAMQETPVTRRQTYAWWQRATIYQIYPRSFQDSDGDGVGDLNGIAQRLDALADLGVDALWISPFYPSPMADFGYDISDYCDVDPLFGTLADFDRLLAAAHARNIRIIIDYVPNHTSDEHPWFRESRASRTAPKRDWYIWRDGREGGPPNNWGSVFGGPAWTWDEATGQYYFHQFTPEQPDLNWRNPDVRQAMFDVLRFWLERGVDGFRMDVVYMIWKHPDMPDQPFNHVVQGANIYGAQRHLYDYNQKGIQPIIRQIREVLDAYSARDGHERVGIGEIWLSIEDLVAYYGQEGDGLHMPFNFSLMEAPWKVEAVRAAVDAYEASLPPNGWPNYVLGNHDRDRLASRIGAAQTRVAAMLLLTLRGTPTLYQGDEIGMENGHITEETMVDPQGLNLGLAYSRDKCRTPMQWSAERSAGFSQGRPWLPISPDYSTRNVQQQRADPHSLLTLYRALLVLRRGHEELQTGSYRALPSDPGTFVYMREQGTTRTLVALNFSDTAKAIQMPASGTILLSTQLDRDGTYIRDVPLRANEGIIVSLTVL